MNAHSFFAAFRTAGGTLTLIVFFLVLTLGLIEIASLAGGADKVSENAGDDAVPLADQFFAGDGSALNTSKWGPDGGPYASPFVPGNVANFNVVNGTGTGGTISVGGINATENFTITSASGTIGGTSGTVNPITVANGKTFDAGAQTWSSGATVGFGLSGPGVMRTRGGTYGGGFVLNSGTLVADGINAMGGGGSNTLTINGGTIAGSGNRDLSGKYPNGISFAGNFQLGALTADVPLSQSAANLTFNNNVALGAATRTIAVGADGTYTFIGVISGAAGSGITVTNNVGATGALTFSGANTYSGPTTLSGGILSVATIGNGGVAGGIGQATNAAANLVFDGGTLRYTGVNATTNRNFTINSGKIATIEVSNTGDLTISGAAAATNGGLAKSGAGLLNLSGNNLYTGETIINAGGALALLGSGSIAGSQLIEIKGGGFFDVSTLTTSLTLAAGQAIRASGTATPGTIATVVTKGLTTAADSPLQFTAFNGTNAPLAIQGSGTVTVASGNPVTVNTTSALGVGDYTLIAKGAAGTVAGTAPTSLTVGGSGLAAGTVGSLVITGGQLVLHVAIGDSNPPTISYTALGNTTSTANRVLSVVIADDTAVANGALLPRVYFRKNAGAYFSTQCGLQSGNQQSGTYDCTIDNALLGGVAGGDTVGYYVIAQDTSGNIRSNPAGVVATNVNTVTTPPTPNTYTIQQTFNGVMSVGTGETLTSLTNNGGLFQALNAGVLTGSLTINITSNLTGETGTHSLNQLTETGVGGYTIFFQASGGARLIEGMSPLGIGLITLNGADRVTFSGLAFGPGGLTFRNLGNAPTIRFLNDSTFDSVLNCVVEGGVLDFGSGVVHIGNGTTTGNDNISITDNTIRDRTDAVVLPPANLIHNSGASTAASNSNATILNNQLINFTQVGIFSLNADNSSITGNNISQTASRTSDLSGLILFVTGTNTVSGNIIRDQNTTGGFAGIMTEVDGSIMLSANRIYNIDNSTGNSFPWVGIQLTSLQPGSTTTAVNNMVSLVPSTASLGADLSGILIDGLAGNFNVNHNSVVVGGPGGADSWAMRRTSTSASTVSMTNNIFFNDRSGAGNHFAAGDANGGMGSWSSDFNLFVGTGASAADFFEYNGGAVDFAGWKTGPPARDINSLASETNVGPYNVGNMFTSPNDLHLRTIGNNPAINAGTNAGVATDFDGQARPFGSAPDIGADEAQTVPTAAEASISGRIATADGRGIKNIRVAVFGGDFSQPVFALTNAFGYFRIEGLRAGETYIVSVSGKRYLFDPPARVVSLGEDAFDVDFVGETR